MAKDGICMRATREQTPTSETRRDLRASGLDILLIATVFVLITGNRIARVGGVVSVIINFGQIYVPIRKGHHTFGITIKWRVGFAGLAAMPGQRRVSGPFHNQQRPAWLTN